MPRTNKTQENDTDTEKGLEASVNDGIVFNMAAAQTAANKQREASETAPNKQQTSKPVPMIHIDEFLLASDLRLEQKAGFKVYAGKLYNTEKGWKDKLEEYENRKYKGGSTK